MKIAGVKPFEKPSQMKIAGMNPSIFLRNG